MLSFCALMSCTRGAPPPSFALSVNSFANSDVQRFRTFVLLPLDAEIEKTSLEFQEYASCVRRVLHNRGLVEVASPDLADVVVLFGYGIGPPQDL